jgi:hypothetical protein
MHPFLLFQMMLLALYHLQPWHLLYLLVMGQQLYDHEQISPTLVEE